VRCLNSKKKKKELSYIVDDSYKNYVEWKTFRHYRGPAFLFQVPEQTKLKTFYTSQTSEYLWIVEAVRAGPVFSLDLDTFYYICAILWFYKGHTFTKKKKNEARKRAGMSVGLQWNWVCQESGPPSVPLSLPHSLPSLYRCILITMYTVLGIAKTRKK
jgi:hypothetical protein